MKKLIAIMLFAVSSLAFALPNPNQIEHALIAGDYQSARSMTQEVLREKPESAKAHLFNSYILVHVDRDKVAAAEELKNVQRLDKKGDVKGSALFGRVASEIETVPSVRQAVQRQVSYQPAVVNQNEGQTLKCIMWTMLIIGAGALIYVLIHRSRSAGDARAQATWQELYPSTTSQSRSSTFVQPSYNPPRQQWDTNNHMHSPPAPQQQGMGMMGTAASVAGGVVAGELLMDAIHSNNGGRHGSRNNSDANSWDDTPVRSSRSYETTAPKVDYETRESSFSSGGGSSWDSGSSSSSSSSSSWDSGSSSSDSSSGGGDW